MSRSDSSKPRMSDVMPTIEVMPMTTPRIVSAERILFVRSVSSAITNDFAPADPYSRRSASIGSSDAARDAG